MDKISSRLVLGACLAALGWGCSSQSDEAGPGRPVIGAGGAGHQGGQAGSSQAGAGGSGQGGEKGLGGTGTGGSQQAGAAGSGGEAGSGGAVGTGGTAGSAGSGCGQEACNGLDDDCNGKVDDLPGCKPLLDVVVMAGQSNMVGLGYNSELPQDEQGPVDGARIYYNDSIHPNGNALQWLSLGPGFGVTEDRFGPELSLARRLRKLRPARNLAVIKVAEGGTGLHDRWNASGGDLYALLMNEVSSRLNDLKTDWTPQLVGFVWMQGESDATDADWASDYHAALANMLVSSRTAMGTPILATVAGLIRPSALWPYAAVVRGATSMVAGQLGEMDVTDTQDLDTQAADPAHYTSASFIELGRRFADSLAARLAPQWSFASGLGSAQGDGWWTCRSRTGTGYDLMTWDSVLQRWKSQDGTTVIGAGMMHPGLTSQAELGWHAPYAGRVTASVQVKDGDAGGGDGVQVELVSGGSTLWSADVANGASASTSLVLDVMQGHELLFRTSAGAASNPLYDTTEWAIELVMATP